MSSVGEVITAMIEHLGEFTHLLIREPPVPPVGAILRTRMAIRLAGRDLRPEAHAQGFRIRLPRSTLVRVERLSELGGEGLWVQPLEPSVVGLVPPECQRCAAAYGYALDVPPGILQQFEVVSKPTSVPAATSPRSRS